MMRQDQNSVLIILDSSHEVGLAGLEVGVGRLF
jgi:hypothetical protein